MEEYNGRHEDRCKFPGQIEGAADNGEMLQMGRTGTRQNGDIPGVTPFLVNKETHSTTLFFPASADLSIRKTEKLSDGVTAVSGTEGVSHVLVKQKMLQSLMSRWKLILALRSSILFSKDWTLASRILGRGGL